MANKARDIAVKTGTYRDAQGNEKGRWQTVGALMKDENGGEFIVLERTFNPAGVPNPQGRDSLVLSCFRPSNQGQGQQQNQQAPSGDAPPAPDGDDIPF